MRPLWAIASQRIRISKAVFNQMSVACFMYELALFKRQLKDLGKKRCLYPLELFGMAQLPRNDG